MQTEMFTFITCLLHLLTSFFHIATFYWMFIEGEYLNKLTLQLRNLEKWMKMVKHLAPDRLVCVLYVLCTIYSICTITSEVWTRDASITLSALPWCHLDISRLDLSIFLVTLSVPLILSRLASSASSVCVSRPRCWMQPHP